MTAGGRAPAALNPVVVVVGLSVVALLAELGYQTTAVAAMPYFLRYQLGLGVAVIGLVNMAFLVSETAAKIPFGSMSDRYGRRVFVIIGPLLSGVAALLMTLVPPPAVVVMLRALDGIGAAMLWPALFAAIADVVEERLRATAMSLFNMMYIGGLVLGPLTYSGVYQATRSHTAIFYVLGAFFLVCVLVAMLVTPRRQRLPAAVDAGGLPAASGRSAWAVIRASQVLTAMLAIAVVQFGGLQMLNGVLSIYLKEEVGVSEVMFGRLFLYIGVLVGVLALPMGRLADSMPRERAIRLGLFVCAVGMWLLPWVHALPLLVAAAGVFGVGFLLAAPAWLALMTQLAGEECRGGVVSIINTAQGVGAAAGVFVGSQLYHHVGPRAPFIASALLFSASVWLVFRYVRPANGADAR